MKKSIFMKLYIIPMILISPFIAMSCNSFFSIWMSLELNLMSFIPMLIFFNKNFKELSIKYFIIQAISSSIFIFFSNSMLPNFNLNLSINMIILMINLSLLIKMGAAPFHLWFINIMMNLNWMNCLMISTWQKIIPMIILMYLFNKNLIYLIMLICSMISVIFGMNHQSIRIIMGYSTINHMSWLLLNLMISENMWIMYFISYSIINMSIMMLFNKMNIYYINQLQFIQTLKNNKFILLFNFFSISGLPPFFGFIMKWLTLNINNFNESYFMIIFMMFMSMITFIFYMRISLSFLMIINIKNKLILINKFYNFNYLMFFFPISFILNIWIMSMWLF